MVEGARLESVYAVTPYRGFESLSLRQTKNPASAGFLVWSSERYQENPPVRRVASSLISYPGLTSLSRAFFVASYSPKWYSKLVASH